MSRFLLLSCNNTLSHVAKCLALREVLEERGHEVFIGVSAARAPFLDRMGQDRYFVLPDIQEANGAPLPGFCWFRPERVEACIRAEVALLQKLQPDSVLGVFRFTGPLSAALANVPYDSLICGSMTPAFPGPLGFAADEPGAQDQAEAMAGFRRTCARRMRSALTALGLGPVDDTWELLVGRRTFLWDYPEFQPLPTTPGYHHVGPVQWTHWPRPEVDADRLDKLCGPVAYVSFGTGSVPVVWLRHLIDVLWLLGYSVALAMGGQSTAAALPSSPERLAAFEFLPIELVLARASLVVCHGGQGLVFEALHQRLPVFVLPMQPEQAQNGLCVERMGCGRRLQRGVVFTGQSSDVEAAFLARPAHELADEIAEFLSNAQTPTQLALASSQIARYRGTDTLATLLATP